MRELLATTDALAADRGTDEAVTDDLLGRAECIKRPPPVESKRCAPILRVWRRSRASFAARLPTVSGDAEPSGPPHTSHPATIEVFFLKAAVQRTISRRAIRS
jgi:hypothetical protein